MSYVSHCEGQGRVWGWTSPPESCDQRERGVSARKGKCVTGERETAVTVHHLPTPTRSQPLGPHPPIPLYSPKESSWGPGCLQWKRRSRRKGKAAPCPLSPAHGLVLCDHSQGLPRSVAPCPHGQQWPGQWETWDLSLGFAMLLAVISRAQFFCQENGVIP